MIHLRARLSLAAVALIAIIGLISGQAGVSATPVTLPASADTYVRSGAADTNEGASKFLRVRASGDNRALVRFDQSALEETAAGRDIVSASLELDISSNGNNWGTSGRTIGAHRLNSAWTEGNGFVDGGSPPNRGAGSGATWACASDSNISNQAKDCSGAAEWEMGKPNQPQLHPWVQAATDEVLITNGLQGTVRFDVTEDVAAFLDGTQNYGWIILKVAEGAPGLVAFHSRNGSSAPRLVLEVEDVGPTDTIAPDVYPLDIADPVPPLEDYSSGASHRTAVYARDDGSGVESVAIFRGTTQLTSTNASCSPACPAEFVSDLTFDLSSLPEGNTTLVARAEDAAGNVTTSDGWTLRVDRTPPGEVSNVRVARFGPVDGVDVAAIAWDPGTDPNLADGSPGTGVASFQYRTRIGAGEWSPTEISSVPELQVEAPLGTVVDVEVRSVDAAGNVSSGTTATLTVFQASEPDPWYLTPEPEHVSLTPAQEAQAIQAAQDDPRIAALVGSQNPTGGDVLPWSVDGTHATLKGADLTLTWDTPLDLEEDWPTLTFDDSGNEDGVEAFGYRMNGTTGLTVQVTFDPLEVVAFEPFGGEIDEDSIEPLPLRSGARTTLVPTLVITPKVESCGGEHVDNPNVYLMTRSSVPRLGPDAIWSWDFCGRIALTASRVRRDSDWPVAFVFRNASSVDRAKQYYAGRFLEGRMWANVADRGPHPADHTPSSNPWDTDEGKYRGSVFGSKIHYRVYGGNPEFGGDDRMFNLRWGYYVVATAHQDRFEAFTRFKTHGRTNLAAEEIAQDIVTWNQIFNTRDTLSRNSIEMRNSARGRQGNRILDNDGRSTNVCQADASGSGCFVE